MLDYYEGERYGGTVGMFQSPYYWWQAGEAFGGMIENWYLCENNTFESLIQDAIIHQAGDSYDFMTENQTMVEGNDDQGIWGLTVMTATERNFTAPDNSSGSSSIPGYLAMAQGVYNTMYSRWDADTCGGGLRWQIFTWNNGYSYKNTIANGCLFNLAARLGRYTGNTTYLDVAAKVFDWLVDVGFVTLSSDSKVYDGAMIDTNCSNITETEWTYNYGIILAGAAYMYNATNGSSVWETNVGYLLDGASKTFFVNDTMYEQACQSSGTCNNDQRSFKSLFSRLLSYTSVMAPFTTDTINTLIETSARGAAESCSGGYDEHTCGLDWTLGKNDAVYGLGEQMCALEIIQGLLIHDRPAPYTADNGGSSKGDVNAGLGSDSDTVASLLQNTLSISQKDRIGASIITAIVLVVLIGGGIWMLF
ncbi:probable Mannan endo-1,6-alpha-mannosidase DFG5 [Saccharomycodes ludwigii]|uniref:Mannan endo-1,6-alpha-mannosidase n=2 Tax=Saccharomycodes ludwigii TaxID=36035 RepID=A0A376BB79_9ASCO|nr:probable Mannan endo-1,6-alpha-mannosidase DFG5 [Saccharomycodes ludwigii]